MVAVSVLVATRNPGSALPGIVRSIDDQTLPLSEFEVVVVDASNDGSAARLQQLAGRRPNVVVLTADATATDAERLDLAVERASGEFVLTVAQHQRLAPRALELLVGRARQTGADLVLGRAVTASASGSVVLPDDADRIEPSEIDLAGCIALVRRSLTAGRPGPGAALLDLPALAAEAGTVSALGRYGCTTQQGRPQAPGVDVSLEAPEYRWADGMLHLTVGVRLPDPVPPAPRAWLVVSQNLAEVALPATIGRDGTTHSVAAVLDPETAEGGHPLDDGPWDLRVRLAWPGREVTLPLTSGPARSAIIAGRPHVVRVANQVLQLDAGATRSSAIGPVPKARATIAESAHGTLVTFDYPTLHVLGDAVLDARLMLDGFGLPARLVCQNGHARLEAYASSLAGTSTLAVVAGGGRPVPTGLRLRVSGTGGMTFHTAPSPRPTTPGGAASAPLVQRLRRRAPGALEPVVHRLAGVPVLRQAYRRLIGR